MTIALTSRGLEDGKLETYPGAWKDPLLKIKAKDRGSSASIEHLPGTRKSAGSISVRQ